MTSAHGLDVTMLDRVAVVTLDRPDRLNALSIGLWGELVDTFDRMSRDDDVWAVLLTGAGDRAFSAGVDLKEINELDAAQADERMRSQPMGGPGRNVFEVVWEFPKPVVAALNGVAAGGGCELALACDLRVAVEGTRIGMPEARRGMGANFGSVLLPRLIAPALAYEMLYTGDLVTVEQAHQWGLINRVLPAETFRDDALALVQQIAANAPLTVRRYKQMITRGGTLAVPAALRLGVGPDPYRSEDRVEGVAAFVERRTPRWRGQ